MSCIELDGPIVVSDGSVEVAFLSLGITPVSVGTCAS
jgi:hypothetical protein